MNKTMINYKFKAHLKNLVLTATDGKLEWIGTESQWVQAGEEMDDYTNLVLEVNRLADNTN